MDLHPLEVFRALSSDFEFFGVSGVVGGQDFLNSNSIQIRFRDGEPTLVRESIKFLFARFGLKAQNDQELYKITLSDHTF